MNKTKCLAGKLGIVLCSALIGCTTYGQPSVEVGVDVPLPSVEINAESDFYAPLAPLGDWVVVGSYGRCWRPARVETGWQPYCSGSWQFTDAGWYWVSDEPWAWATYHYGRWDFNDQFGWYWVPQTQWAPAWVSWHEGGGYVGWAPLYPSGVTVISPQAYVFVQERNFMQPVSRSTVVVNSAAIISQTVINKGPATATIEKASGRKIQAVPAQALRQKTESAVASQQRTPASSAEKMAGTPVRNEVQPAEQKAAPAHESVVPAPEFKPGADQPPAIKEPAGQNVNQQPVKQEKSAQPSDQKEPQPARENPAAGVRNEANPAADKDHENKPNE